MNRNVAFGSVLAICLLIVGGCQKKDFDLTNAKYSVQASLTSPDSVLPRVVSWVEGTNGAQQQSGRSQVNNDSLRLRYSGQMIIGTQLFALYTPEVTLPLGSTFTDSAFVSIFRKGSFEVSSNKAGYALLQIDGVSGQYSSKGIVQPTGRKIAITSSNGYADALTGSAVIKCRVEYDLDVQRPSGAVCRLRGNAVVAFQRF
jgi:hypothetical protein